MGMKGRKKIGRPRADKLRAQDPVRPGIHEFGGGVILEPPEVMRPREAAYYLRIEVNTLGILRRDGAIPHFRLGPRAVRYRKADLDRRIAGLVEEARVKG